jgi:hypothetical protein
MPGFLTSFLRLCLNPIRFVLGEEFGSSKLALLALGLVALGAVGCWALLLRRPWRPSFAARAAALGAVIFLLSHLAAYAWVLHSYVPWYAAIPMLIAAAWFGLGAAELAAAIQVPVARGVLVGALAAIAAAVGMRFFSLHPIAPRGEERDVAAGLSLITRTHPEVRTIGAHNAGAMGYFAPAYGSYRVVNLDCLVNNRAFDAWRRGDYEGYLVRTIDLLWFPPDEWDDWLTASEKARVEARYPHWAGWDIYGPRLRDASAIFQSRSRSNPTH